MKRFSIVLLVVLFSHCSSGQHNLPTTVVKVAVEALSPEAIDAMAVRLSDNPSGLGEPLANREAWDQLRNTGKFNTLLKDAGIAVGGSIPAWDDSKYMAFYEEDDSESGKQNLRERLSFLVLLTWAECLENKGLYISKIEETIQEIAEQKSWVNTRNDINLQNYKGLRYNVDLSAARYAATLGQVVYLLGSKLPAGSRATIRAAVKKRVFDPVLSSLENGNKDQWWLTTTNNWNAVCLSGVTLAAMTLLEDKRERAKFAVIAERYSQNYLYGFGDDGYCSEGLGYYNYGFGNFIVLRETMLNATNDKIDFFSKPGIGKIAAYVPGIQIASNVYPSIGDCKPGQKPSRFVMNYLNANLGWHDTNFALSPALGKVNDLTINILGAFPKTRPSTQPSGLPHEDSQPLRSYFYEAGVLTVRPGKLSDTRLAATFKGGNNAEHHNHNDLGSFTLVVGGEVLVGDPGMPAYNAKTFGKDRYAAHSISSYGHPVPRIGGQLQKSGKAANAVILDTAFSSVEDRISMDLTAAYPKELLKKLTRTFLYNRRNKGYIEIRDNVMMQRPEKLEQVLITRGRWRRVGSNTILITGIKESLLITISTLVGNEIEISDEVITEYEIPFRRIAISYIKPVVNASLTLKFEQVGPLENSMD